MRRFLLSAFVGILGATPSVGQSGSQRSDSLRHYEMSEIVVGAGRDRTPEPVPVRRVPLAEIVRLAAPDVAAVARLVPSAHAQTNSRGETLVYVRGSGERQVATFLDGALLNVPWDNRVDLGLLPASVLGGAGVVGGAASVLYGTNTLGGVVLLSSRSLDREGSMTDLNVSGGTGPSRRLDAMHLFRRGRGALLAAVGWSDSDGYRAPGGADFPYGGVADGLRLNTDRRLAHVFVRGELEGRSGSMGVSVLHVDSEQGVAPEAHLDPATDPVRWWRYPDWRTTMVTLNGRSDLGVLGAGRLTAWVSRFSQRIDQYDSDRYDTVSDREDDDDLTVGARLLAERRFVGGNLRLAVNALTSTHDQVDAATGESGVLTAAGTARYRQQVWSLGADYRRDLSRRLHALAGISLDGIATPLTGDKPARGPQTAWGATLGGTLDLAEEWTVRLALGRKVRFPTARELFGTALNRFLVNPDLRPESAWSSEATVERLHPGGSAVLTAFARRTVDTIDQESVQVGESRLRRRINLDGSTVFGIEATGEIEPNDGLEIEGILTVMRIRPVRGGVRDRVVERPEVLGTLTATWTARWGGAVTLQAVHTGRAWGLAPDNGLVALPRATQVNARVAWRHYLSRRGIFVETFARVDNLFDATVIPQLGLPSPGRSGRIGLGVSF